MGGPPRRLVKAGRRFGAALQHLAKRGLGLSKVWAALVRGRAMLGRGWSIRSKGLEYMESLRLLRRDMINVFRWLVLFVFST